ncbi:hypothetical protein SAY86_004313 [Trapa natans]|uniref:SPARK domain-containing protein n=1 Tax=Trapa natans TaxID=22666 RepID=A0AAN7RNN3_TRANT|nr:hypothetical protein SAY86_004313 [Trapa natans]
MPPHPSPLLLPTAFLFLLLPLYSAWPIPENTQPLHLPPSPPTTIPAFPDQSAAAGCPLDLPEELFSALHSACNGELHRSRCCPVLAAWLYFAYSSTALNGTTAIATSITAASGQVEAPFPSYMPLLPDDSETCIDGLGNALRERGVRLSQPNETCDLVYCYCGIRLHPLTCPETFFIGSDGKLHGDENVKRLESDCFDTGNSTNDFPGLDGCSKCLNSLHMLTGNDAFDQSKTTDSRTARMHNMDCHLMGLTWLLSRNRSAYIYVVSNVLRAIMLSPVASSPRSCVLGSDGLPLAVDSLEVSGVPLIHSTLRSSIKYLLVWLFVMNYYVMIRQA